MTDNNMLDNNVDVNVVDSVVQSADSVKESAGNTVGKFTEKVNEMIGGQGKVDLKLMDLFSGVIKHHTEEEADEIFICGTKTTTPAPEDISTSWPKPWLFSRVGLVLIVTSLVLYEIYNLFGNMNAVPGFLFMGSLAVPFAGLIFLFEVNAPRNISFFKVLTVFLLGGVLSLFLTLGLFEINLLNSDITTLAGAFGVGIVEEIGKFVLVAFMIKWYKKSKYILNGLLIGGAVGAGFAVFESAGYAFRYFLMGSVVGQGMGVALHTIITRAYLSPGGHIAWAAMEGAFIVIALKGKPFNWGVLATKDFLSLVWIPIVLHAIWDMPVLNINLHGFHLKTIGLAVIACIIVLVIIHRGLEQINNLKVENS